MNSLKKYLTDAWWLLFTVSVSLIIFGLLALLLPGATIVLLMQILAAFIIAWGVSQIIGGLRAQQSNVRGVSVVAGILVICVGLIFLFNPNVSAETLAVAAGMIILLYGLVNLAFSSVFPSGSRGRLYWMSSGVMSVAAALIIWIFPGGSARVAIMIIGAYAVMNGLALLLTAIDMRRAFSTAAKRVKKEIGEVIDAEEVKTSPRGGKK